MDNPALTLALAFATGMVAQTVAHHIRIPGIVLFLAAGVLLGPDVANIIRPETLGSALQIIVGFSVAVILFEGGMNLRIKRIKREKKAIQKLITIGAMVTAIGGYFAARIFLGWEWRSALLFGTLVIVTGPTVITPLLRRLKLRLSVSTVLEAEGVLLDAIGAIIAIVTLEIVLSPEGIALAKGIVHILFKLSTGIIFGAIGGFVLALILRKRNLIPEGLENVFTLAIAFVLYQGSNALNEESGIVAVTIAGFVVGNMKTNVKHELMEFKESITVLLIGMLFVLLAADVRLSDVLALGWGAVFTVVAMVVIVRPLNIAISTAETNLNIKQKTLLSFFAPRGIVAAAIASLFAIRLHEHGFDGSQLRAMVFILIAVTVVLTGFSGGLVAKLLGLQRKRNNGWVILGANEIGRILAKYLIEGSEEVVCIDSNPKNCKLAEDDGIKIINNNGLEDNILLRAEIDTRRGAIGLTDNEEVNFLFTKKAKMLGKVANLLVSIKQDKEGITQEMVEEFGGSIPFVFARDLEQWNVWLSHDKVEIINCKFQGNSDTNSTDLFDDSTRKLILPIVSSRKEKIIPVSHKTKISNNDVITILLNRNRLAEADKWLSDKRLEQI